MRKSYTKKCLLFVIFKIDLIFAKLCKDTIVMHKHIINQTDVLMMWFIHKFHLKY